MRRLQNFIGGAFHDARGRPDRPPWSIPRPGRCSPRRPCRVRPTWTAPFAWRPRRSPRGGGRTPSERSLALYRIADAIEARGEELVRAECENTGKPFQLTMDEELPPMVDQIRFFAGAARHLQGLSAGEYMAGHTSFIRREPDRRVRRGDAVELSHA